MLAQTVENPFAATVSALVAALVLAGPVSIAVTKLVDFLRNLLDENNSFPPWVWNVAAFVIGIAVCLGWGINLMDGIVSTIPALAEGDTLTGTAGTVLTGLLVGGAAGFWHGKLQQYKNTAPVPPAMPADPDVVFTPAKRTR